MCSEKADIHTIHSIEKLAIFFVDLRLLLDMITFCVLRLCLLPSLHLPLPFPSLSLSLSHRSASTTALASFSASATRTHAARSFLKVYGRLQCRTPPAPHVAWSGQSVASVPFLQTTSSSSLRSARGHVHHDITTSRAE